MPPRQLTDNRRGVCTLIRKQPPHLAETILESLGLHERRYRLWKGSPASARREFCEVLGHIQLSQQPELANSIMGLSHKELCHFIIIWRYEHTALENRRLSYLFDIANQSASIWMRKAEISQTFAFKIVLTFIGYDNLLKIKEAL